MAKKERKGTRSRKFVDNGKGLKLYDEDGNEVKSKKPKVRTKRNPKNRDT